MPRCRSKFNIMPRDRSVKVKYYASMPDHLNYKCLRAGRQYVLIMPKNAEWIIFVLLFIAALYRNKRYMYMYITCIHYTCLVSRGLSKLTTHAYAVTVPDSSEHSTGLLAFLYFKAEKGVEPVTEVLLFEDKVGLIRWR